MRPASVGGSVFLRLILLGVGLALTSASARADRQVVVRATAGKTYLADRTAAHTADPAKVETYVFMPGRYFESGVGDNSLKNMPFIRIAETLAGDLVQQGYRPAADLQQADLILVVHWGMTARTPPDYELYPGKLEALYNTMQTHRAAVDAARTGSAMSGTVSELGAELNFQHMTFSTDQLSQDLAAASTAELLGLRPRSRKEQKGRTDERRRTLMAMEQEDRYFMLVMAYDARALREEGKFRRVWTSRMSMRSAGVNFPIALTRMSLAAGPTFGTEPENLVIKRVRERETDIEIGEPLIVVLGTTDNGEKTVP